MHYRIGMDKIAHFGIGGIIGAAIAIVFILSFIKEKFMDDEYNWLDILASVLGSIAVHMAFIIGLTINELVK